MTTRDPRQPYLTAFAPPPPPRQTLLPLPTPASVTERHARPANLATKRALSRMIAALDDLATITPETIAAPPPVTVAPPPGTMAPPMTAPPTAATLFDPEPTPAPDQDEPAPDHRRIATGIYAIDTTVIRLEPTTWGDHDPGTRTLKIKRRREDTDRAWVGVGFLRPDGSVAVWRSQRDDHGALSPAALDATRALDLLTLANDPTAHGFAYALLSGKCWVCGAQLDDPVSIASLIGPTCARNRGIDRRNLDGAERAKAATVTLLEALT